ncbi:MAG TPA: ABC transporter ATP-binding protein, partial [Candidatus Woesebacteria bacterium]|nr:ABC transporter ATP-binding protein [Candidatus Woesebacteria bacterium]
MNNIFKVIQLAKPFHKYFFAISAVILFSTALALVSPYLIKLIVDQIELQITKGIGDINKLYFFIGLLFTSSVLSITFDSLNQRLGDFTRARVGKFLIETFYRKIFTLPQGYFDSQISGKIVNQLNRGILSLQDFLGQASNFIIPAIIRSVFIIVLLAFYSVPIALMVLIIFPFYIYISSYSTKKWGEKEMIKNQIEDATRGRIQEVINNIRLVKGYSTQYKEYKFVSQNMKKSIAIYDKQSTTYHILNFIRNFGLEIGLIIISIMVFYNTFTGTLSIGVMVLILQYLN